MRTLLVFVLLVVLGGVAHADRRYAMRGTAIVERNERACGYGKRIMRHVRVVKERRGRFYVNMVPFKDIQGDSSLPGWATLRYVHQDGSRSIVQVYANDRKVIGLYILRTRKGGRACTDVVRLEGERL